MKTTLLFLALSLCAAAQTMVGLPGVDLQGTAAFPVIVNHSGHTISGFVLRFLDGNGRGPVHDQIPLTFELPPHNSIPDGKSFIAVGVVDPAHQATFRSEMPPGAPNLAMQGFNRIVSRVELDAYVLDDGTFIGPDKGGSFAEDQKRMLAMSQMASVLLNATDKKTQFAAIAQAASWQPTDGLPDGVDRKDHHAEWVVASALNDARNSGGEGAALALAAKVAHLPVLHK